MLARKLSALSCVALAALVELGCGSSAPPEEPGTREVRLAMKPFAVPPGEEVYKCQNFSNPFDDDTVVAFESSMTPGSHHLLLFYENFLEDGPVEDCSGLEIGVAAYGSQTPHDVFAYPKGVGWRPKPSQGLRLQSHYLNTGGEYLPVDVEILFRVAPSKDIPEEAGVLLVVDDDFAVPAHETQVVSHTCATEVDVKLLSASGHMHKHGTKFEASVAGSKIYETSSWSEPEPAAFDPPFELRAGEPLSFSCTIQNDSDKTLTFGESASDNEMCVFAAQVYPLSPDFDSVSLCR